MRFPNVKRGRPRDTGIIDERLNPVRIHGYPTVIDTYSSYVPIRLIDTNDTTQWISNSKMPNVWCKLDLGSAKVITKARLYQNTAVSVATQYKIESSDDDSTWTLQHTSAAGLGVGEYIVYIPYFRARYWRWWCLAGSASYGWDVMSIELWGLVF